MVTAIAWRSVGLGERQSTASPRRGPWLWPRHNRWRRADLRRPARGAPERAWRPAVAPDPRLVERRSPTAAAPRFCSTAIGCAAAITAEQVSAGCRGPGPRRASTHPAPLGPVAASRQYGTRDKGGVNAVGRERNRAGPGCVWVATVPEEERSSDIRIGPALGSSGREYVIALIRCAAGRDWDTIGSVGVLPATPQLRF